MYKAPPFMWPGVEGVMDAYQRHVAGESLYPKSQFIDPYEFVHFIDDLYLIPVI